MPLQIIDTEIGHKIIKLNTISSTNTYASSLIKNLKNEDTDLYKLSGLIISTDYQIAGKGTDKNYWESERGKNLLLSIILTPFFLEPVKQFQISKIVSLAITDYLKEKNIDVKIKWPNDIYVKNKKIGGILIENSILNNTITTSVVGIGVNINQTSFSEQLPNPTSLLLETNVTFDLQIELNLLIKKIQKRYTELEEEQFEKINNEYTSIMLNQENYVKYKANNEHFFAKNLHLTRNEG